MMLTPDAAMLQALAVAQEGLAGMRSWAAGLAEL